MEVRVETVLVDALDGIRIERNAYGGGYSLADSSSEVEPVCMPVPWRCDDAPAFRITDMITDEIGGGICKLAGNLSKLLNLAEWNATLGSPELREINHFAELVKNGTCRQVTKRDIPGSVEI